MFGEDSKQMQSDEFFGLFSAFLVSFAVSVSFSVELLVLIKIEDSPMSS